MKRSELKEAIKAEIKSVLSEAKFVKFKGDKSGKKFEVEAEREMNTPDGELKVYTVRTDDGLQSYDETQVELVSDIRPRMTPQIQQIVDLFMELMDDEFNGVPYGTAINRVIKAIDDEYKAAERQGERFSRIREEDEGPSKKEVEAEKSIAKQKDIELSKQQRKKEVADFMKKMQDKGIVGKDKKVLDSAKYKEEFAKFKADLKK